MFELPPDWVPGDPMPAPNPDRVRLSLSYDACRLRADINGDDKVNMQDYSILQSNFGKCSTPQQPINLPQGDVNGDQCVTILDFSILSSEYNQMCSNSGL